MVLSDDGAMYVDPYSREDILHYRSYFYRDYERTDAQFKEDAPEQVTDLSRTLSKDLNQPAHGTQTSHLPPGHGGDR
jgi:hypothetical protein